MSDSHEAIRFFEFSLNRQRHSQGTYPKGETIAEIAYNPATGKVEIYKTDRGEYPRVSKE